MNTLELFCGTKSFSKVMAAHGHETCTVDFNPIFEPDFCVDILNLDLQMIGVIGKKIDILWASPPCTHFSVAAISHNWRYIPDKKTGVLTAINPDALVAQEIVKKTLAIIKEIQPRYFFIENPMGMLRKMPFMQGMIRHTVSYCQFGEDRQKPTDIWTDAEWYHPTPICKRGAPCHQAAPRGAKTGTQGMRNSILKGVIPPPLFEQILEQYPR